MRHFQEAIDGGERRKGKVVVPTSAVRQCTLENFDTR